MSYCCPEHGISTEHIMVSQLANFFRVHPVLFNPSETSKVTTYVELQYGP